MLDSFFFVHCATATDVWSEVCGVVLPGSSKIPVGLVGLYKHHPFGMQHCNIVVLKNLTRWYLTRWYR